MISCFSHWKYQVLCNYYSGDIKAPYNAINADLALACIEIFKFSINPLYISCVNL